MCLLQEEDVEDEDVAAERARVASGGAASDSLCLKNLRKVYGSGAAAKVGFSCWDLSCAMQRGCAEDKVFFRSMVMSRACVQVAVHDLCLGVHPGERFGLLGPNGAGACCLSTPHELLMTDTPA